MYTNTYMYIIHILDHKQLVRVLQFLPPIPEVSRAPRCKRGPAPAAAGRRRSRCTAFRTAMASGLSICMYIYTYTYTHWCIYFAAICRYICMCIYIYTHHSVEVDVDAKSHDATCSLWVWACWWSGVNKRGA